MHLFLLDLYISIDTLAPVIDTLNPKKLLFVTSILFKITKMINY